MAIFLVIAFFAIIAYGRWLLNSPRFKGALGERRVNLALKRHLPEEYEVLSDLTIPCLGKTTQIDHIVISCFGIFVIETKNMKGWIFGDKNQSKWTQVIYRYKNRFQNPLRQNFKHVKAVQSIISVNQNDIHNIVVFTGSAKPQTEMPEYVLWDIKKLIDYILWHNNILFDENEVAEIKAKLSKTEFETNNQNRQSHIKNLEEIINLCPKCGATLKLRTNKQTDSKFLGCTRFPKCKGTRPI